MANLVPGEQSTAAKPRRVEADADTAGALHRRTELGWMLEDKTRVRVVNPFGGTWTGRIVALADHPAMLLERDDGRRVMLPQCFAVEELPGEVREAQEDEAGEDGGRDWESRPKPRPSGRSQS